MRRRDGRERDGAVCVEEGRRARLEQADKVARNDCELVSKVLLY